MRKWTSYEDNYIKDHYENEQWADIASALNRSIDSVKGHAKKLGVKRTEYGVFFTPEEDNWLRENVPNYRYCDLVILFQKQFGRKVTEYSLRSRACQRLGIQSGRRGFKKNMITHNVKPIGYEMTTKHGGYTYVKVNNTGVKSKDFVAKHRLVYEQTHGEIPKGHIVIFLDGDKQNFESDNLYAVNRWVHRMMCQDGYFTELGSKELTLAAIARYELLYALKQMEK